MDAYDATGLSHLLGNSQDLQSVFQVKVRSEEEDGTSAQDSSLAASGAAGDTVSISDAAKALSGQAVQAAEEGGETEDAGEEESSASDQEIERLEQRIEEIEQEIREVNEEDLSEEEKQQKLQLLNMELMQYQQQLQELQEDESGGVVGGTSAEGFANSLT